MSGRTGTVTRTWVSPTPLIQFNSCGCFGGVVTVPDANGDGRPDVVVSSNDCSAPACPPSQIGRIYLFHSCAADFNYDGVHNSQDFFDFLSAFFQSWPGGDFNRDSFFNSQDFFDFLEAFFQGC